MNLVFVLAHVAGVLIPDRYSGLPTAYSQVKLLYLSLFPSGPPTADAPAVNQSPTDIACWYSKTFWLKQSVFITCINRKFAAEAVAMPAPEPKNKRQKKGEPDEQLEPKGKPACTRGRECEDYGHPAPCKAREETPAAGLKKILSWEEKVAEEARSKTPLKWED